MNFDQLLRIGPRINILGFEGIINIQNNLYHFKARRFFDKFDVNLVENHQVGFYPLSIDCALLGNI